MRVAPAGHGRRAAARAAVLLLALALGGCETTAERSAQLERQARPTVLAQHGLSIARSSSYVKVLATQVLHSSEGTAVAVTLRNASAHALRDVPIAIAVEDSRGSVLYANNAPGLEAALTSVSLLGSREQVTWVDDQVHANGVPARASAIVGEAPQAPAGTPRMRLAGVHPVEEASGAGAAGTVLNDSAIAQRGLVVYGIARRGGAIVAAGRALLAEVPAHGSSPFQIFFIGSPQGAQLQVSAPATTLG